MLYFSIVYDQNSIKLLEKIRTAFEEIDSQYYRLWLFAELSKEYVQKILRQHYWSKISPRYSIPYTEEILLVIVSPKKLLSR